MELFCCGFHSCWCWPECAADLAACIISLLNWNMFNANNVVMTHSFCFSFFSCIFTRSITNDFTIYLFFSDQIMSKPFFLTLSNPGCLGCFVKLWDYCFVLCPFPCLIQWIYVYLSSAVSSWHECDGHRLVWQKCQPGAHVEASGGIQGSYLSNHAKCCRWSPFYLLLSRSLSAFCKWNADINLVFAET